MRRTQVYLRDEQDTELKRLAERTGRGQSELFRDAIDLLLARQSACDRRDAFRGACGMWSGRDDVVADMAEARASIRARFAAD